MHADNPTSLSLFSLPETQCFAWLYLQVACHLQWEVLLRSDPAAAAAAPGHKRAWSHAEEAAVLAVGEGKAGAQTVAFWEKACPAHPTLDARTPVRCLNRCASRCKWPSSHMVASNHAWSGHNGSMHVWWPSYDLQSWLMATLHHVPCRPPA
jgi:hypothetical protein